LEKKKRKRAHGYSRELESQWVEEQKPTSEDIIFTILTTEGHKGETAGGAVSIVQIRKLVQHKKKAL